MTVAHDRLALRNILEGDLVALRDGLNQCKAIGEGRAFRQPALIYYDCDIVALVDFDAQRRAAASLGSALL